MPTIYWENEEKTGEYIPVKVDPDSWAIWQSEYQTLIDSTTTSGITYICKAVVWTPTSEAKWKIVSIDWSGSKKYPQINSKPSKKFEFIADNRASYTYSYN
jgi:hypothetical protein